MNEKRPQDFYRIRSKANESDMRLMSKIVRVKGLLKWRFIQSAIHSEIGKHLEVLTDEERKEWENEKQEKTEKPYPLY